MEDFKKKGEDLNKSLQESRRKVAEAQKKVQELTISAADDTKAELTKAQTEEKKLKKEEREWEKKFDEFNREEKKMPWNVDTLSKEGFSKVMPTKWRVVHFIDHTTLVNTFPLLIHYEHILMSQGPQRSWIEILCTLTVFLKVVFFFSPLPLPFVPLQQSIVNVVRDASEETEEEKEKKHKTFVEKYEKQIKHFGNIHSFSSSAFCQIHWYLIFFFFFFWIKACCDAGMTARDTSPTTPP